MMYLEYKELDIFTPRFGTDNTPFNTKKNMYIKYLEKARRNLELSLEYFCRNSKEDSSTTYKVLSILNNESFDLRTIPELDIMYFFYQNLISYSSRIEGLNRHSDLFPDELFEEAYKTTDTLFNAGSTPGQPYSYFDRAVFEIGKYFNTVANDLELSTSTTQRLKIINSCNLNIAQKITDFTLDVSNASNELNMLTADGVIYINTINLSYKILENTLGSYAVGPGLSSTISQYNKSACENTDGRIASYAIASQIFEQVRPILEKDQSNFTKIIKQSLALAFEHIKIKETLEKIKK